MYDQKPGGIQTKVGTKSRSGLFHCDRRMKFVVDVSWDVVGGTNDEREAVQVFLVILPNDATALTNRGTSRRQPRRRTITMSGNFSSRVGLRVGVVADALGEGLGQVPTLASRAQTAPENEINLKSPTSP